MTTIGVITHHHRPDAIELAMAAVAWATERGIDVVLPKSDAELVGRSDLGCDPAEFGPDLDVCLSLGGDGTMLRSSTLVSPFDVPILGVNVGSLGYLSAFDVDELESTLEDWRADRLSVEERMLLAVELEGADGPLAWAMNEVLVDRAQSGHSVRVDAYISDRFFTTYLVDGLIVATPTGSTAYSMSAGGPIVEPSFDAMILTPVSPHHVFNRSLVLSPRSQVRLKVAGHRPAVVVVDGVEIASLEPGQTVTARRAEKSARLLVRQGRDFHSRLKDKFGLSDR